MAEIEKTSGDAFKNDVLESQIPVLVDFTAVWCQPCKMLEPIVKQLAEEWGEKVKVLKLDVDDSPQLAMDYGILGVPTLMMFVSGEAVERATGFQPKDRLSSRFKRFVK